MSAPLSAERGACGSGIEGVGAADQAHVGLCDPIHWSTRSRDPSSSNKVVFDDYHNEVMLLRGSPVNAILLSDSQAKRWIEYPLKLTKPVECLSGKLSTNKQFIAF